MLVPTYAVAVDLKREHTDFSAAGSLVSVVSILGVFGPVALLTRPQAAWSSGAAVRLLADLQLWLAYRQNDGAAQLPDTRRRLRARSQVYG
jgi:hypothetical protein